MSSALNIVSKGVVTSLDSVFYTLSVLFEVHKLTEQIWESKKKNVKQMMMKIGWGSAAMRMSVFVAWKDNITKVKVERIIEEDARTRHRSPGA